MPGINRSTFKFLSDLKKNNSKEWMDKNKSVYQDAKADFENFLEHILAGISEFDPNLTGLEVKKSTFRLNRDVRFSNDKTPYKSYFSAVFVEGGKKNMDSKAGYFVKVAPGDSLMIGGAHQPPPPWIGTIRARIDKDSSSLKKIIGAKDFKEHYGAMSGEQLKTAPKGYPKDHPEIELLRYKDFMGVSKISDSEVTSADFDKQVIKRAKAIKPLNDYLNN